MIRFLVKTAIEFCSYGMAKEVLDWYGNPIPGIVRCRRKDTGFRVYEDEHGKEYWMNEGKRDYHLPFLKVSDAETGQVVYDSRCEPPTDANLLPGYIGEKHLYRKRPQCV
jgi:hypothetical protein